MVVFRRVINLKNWLRRQPNFHRPTTTSDHEGYSASRHGRGLLPRLKRSWNGLPSARGLATACRLRSLRRVNALSSKGSTEGLDYTEIPTSLALSEKTVRNHITRLFDKIGVEHRYQAIGRARDAGPGRNSMPRSAAPRRSSLAATRRPDSSSKLVAHRHQTRPGSASCGHGRVCLR